MSTLLSSSDIDGLSCTSFTCAAISRYKNDLSLLSLEEVSVVQGIMSELADEGTSFGLS